MSGMYGSLFLHANMHYAEIPVERLPDLAARSYRPALQALIDRPGLKAALEFSGFTLEWLAAHAPDVIDQVRALLARGDAELLASTYADPILPLIPPDDGERQIRRFMAIHDRLFGDLGHRPRGFYAQEYAVDASVVDLLAGLGFEWVVVSSGQYQVSRKGLLNSALQRIPPQEEFRVEDAVPRPFRIRGARGRTLAALTWNMPGPNDLLFRKAPPEEAEAYLRSLGAGFLLLCPADMEFVGDLPPQGSLAPDRMCAFVQSPAVTLALPSDYLAQHPPAEEIYLKCGAGARFSDLQNWTVDPDNARLNALADDARSQIRLARALVDLVNALGFSTEAARGQLSQAEELLLLADNSDGRGWKPLPERRLACYDAALGAREAAAGALNLATNAVREGRRA